MNGNSIVALADWRRCVSVLYATIRVTEDPRIRWEIWRGARLALFRDHSQLPIDSARRSSYHGVPVFAYDPPLRFLVAVEVLADILEEVWDIGADGRIRVLPGLRTVGLRAALGAELTVFQTQGYGGGMLLPLKDGTSGAETYGCGRYLLNSIKGADLGTDY